VVCKAALYQGFRFTAQDIEDDVRANRQSPILERIVAARKTSGCQCAK
jgi:hypothetical protein